jgi:hypothetical protein
MAAVPQRGRWGRRAQVGSPTEQALREASAALTAATWALERAYSQADVRDLPTPAIKALTEVNDALSKALATIESYRT